MKDELIGWGIAMLVLGVLHIVLSSYLDPAWGVVLLVLGTLNILVRKRGMFIVNGLAMFLVAFANIFGGGFGPWTIFGLFQFYWGVQLIRKFNTYKPVEEIAHVEVAR